VKPGVAPRYLESALSFKIAEEAALKSASNDSCRKLKNSLATYFVARVHRAVYLNVLSNKRGVCGISKTVQFATEKPLFATEVLNYFIK